MAAAYPKAYLYQRIVRAKLFIDNNFTRSLELDNIAEEACFSKFHFIRLFASAYGCTPHQYMMRKRIDYARQLLATGRTMTETCFESGFESVSSFSMLFKRSTGSTPSAWQQAQLRKQAEVQHIPLKHIPHCFARSNGWAK